MIDADRLKMDAIFAPRIGFKPGDRVTMTADARRQFKRRKSFDGTVKTVSKKSPSITVFGDGYKGPERWAAIHWELLTTTT